jgi:hypothetical protein
MQIAPDGTTRLTSRNGNDITDEFADLAGVFGSALDGQPAVLDGEIVVCNEAGHPEFGMLQERRGRYQTQRSSIRRDEPFYDLEVRFLAFDLLQLWTKSLLGAPHDQRRQQLVALPMPDPYRVAVVRAFTFTELDADRRTPEHLLAHVAATGHEGLVAKNRRALYTPDKRTDAWLKHPLIQTTEVIVCGWRPGQRGLTGKLGGLLLGAHDPDTGDLRYIGDVGTGFKEAQRADLQNRLAALERPQHPIAVTPPREDVARARWVDPVLVGEVVYRQFTRGTGRVRHTSWRGLRADKAPGDVVAPRTEPRAPAQPLPAEPAPTPEPPATPVQLGSKITVQAGNRQLTLSNLDKALYPDGFTKAQIIQYYSHIAPVMLPHLAGRPVTVGSRTASASSSSSRRTSRKAPELAAHRGAAQHRRPQPPRRARGADRVRAAGRAGGAGVGGEHGRARAARPAVDRQPGPATGPAAAGPAGVRPRPGPGRRSWTAWLLPADPDASARALRDQLAATNGAEVAVVIADSDGRADRLGATVISIGAAGVAPLRVTEHTEPGGKVKRQEETFTDMLAATAGIVLGQRGRGCPAVVIRGVQYDRGDAGVGSMLHR